MYLFLQDYLVRVPTPACYQPNSTINSIKHVYTLTTDQCMFYGTLNSNSLHHLLYRVPPLCLLSPLLTHNSWEYQNYYGGFMITGCSLHTISTIYLTNHRPIIPTTHPSPKNSTSLIISTLLSNTSFYRLPLPVSKYYHLPLVLSRLCSLLEITHSQ